MYYDDDAFDDDVFAAADRCYSQVFRTESFTLNDVKDESYKEDLIDELFYNSPIDYDKKIVELCNYKGEGVTRGDYVAFEDDVKHLPIFKSKMESYSLFGC